MACLDSGIDGFIFSGSYDGSISIHKHSGEEIAVSKVHDGPVKGISVARILEESGSDHYFVSQVRRWYSKGLEI